MLVNVSVLGLCWVSVTGSRAFSHASAFSLEMSIFATIVATQLLLRELLGDTTGSRAVLFTEFQAKFFSNKVFQDFFKLKFRVFPAEDVLDHRIISRG